MFPVAVLRSRAAPHGGAAGPASAPRALPWEARPGRTPGRCRADHRWLERTVARYGAEAVFLGDPLSSSRVPRLGRPCGPSHAIGSADPRPGIHSHGSWRLRGRRGWTRPATGERQAPGQRAGVACADHLTLCNQPIVMKRDCVRCAETTSQIGPIPSLQRADCRLRRCWLWWGAWVASLPCLSRTAA